MNTENKDQELPKRIRGFWKKENLDFMLGGCDEFTDEEMGLEKQQSPTPNTEE